MANVKAKLDQSIFKRRVKKLTADAERATLDALRESMQFLVREARREHKFKSRTGKLRRAIKYRTNRAKMEGTLYIDDKVAYAMRPSGPGQSYKPEPYGVFVHEPTGTHRGATRYPIEPSRNHEFMWWRDENTGRLRRAKLVWHPGSAEDRFIDNAISRNAKEIRSIFKRRLAQAVR